ncbi:MAG TPA: hypothetical protein VM008_09285 [Phycisphaerae bacterium]|nr:hypothetical protein [Phycisphaerae bacterium]
MALSLNQMKRDFTRHRKKSAVLGVLSLVMVVMFIKAWFELRPQAAAAIPVPIAPSAASDDSSDETPINPEERLRQSRELWKVMREKRGLDAAAAFRFDPSYFPIDPNRRANPDESRVLLSRVPIAAVSEEMQRAEREHAIREEARGLIVKSTVVGNASSRPVAVINERFLTVGDVISGFTITSIQAREVDFKKDGITLAVKMADNGPVQ